MTTTKEPHKGFLSKKNSGWFAGSAKAFWVLDPSKVTFASYNAPGDEGLDGGATRTVKCAHILKVQRKAGAKFTVVMQSETMLFTAKNEQARDEWIEAFSYVLMNIVPDDAPQLPSREIVGGGGAGGKNQNEARESVSASGGSGGLTNAKSEHDLKRAVSRKMMNNGGGDGGGGVPGDRASQSAKRDGMLKDQQVFMGKARNFAFSTNKETMESIRKKGATPYKKDGDDGEPGNETGNKRLRVIPINIPEEQIEESRFVKTEAQNALLLKVVSEELADFMGGNLFKEVRPQAVVDLMFRVLATKGQAIVTQGEPTDRLFVIESGICGVYTQDFVDRPPELEVEKQPGDFFGALSLLYNQPGPFTIKSHEDCVLWALSRKRFHDLTTNETKKRIGRKIHLLEGVPLIKDNLDQSNIVQLADVVETVVFNDGDFVLRRGDALTKLLVVSEGTAQMVDEESSTVVDELGKGDAFGEWALLDIGAKADVTLRAAGQLTVLTLAVHEIEELIGPIREYVTKRWAEERGSQFFFANGARGGTVFDPASDVRNPLSRANATVQFGNSSAVPPSSSSSSAQAPTTSGGGPSIPEGSVPQPLTKEQEDRVIQEVIQAAKNRATTSGRKSDGKRKTDAAAAKKASVTAATLSQTTSQQQAVQPPPPVEEEPPPPPSDDEEESDEEGIVEEKNLDKPFDYAPPVRTELVLKSIKCCALLGRGNFGRVHLCRNEANHKELFALKVLARNFIVQNGWEVLVENERNAMLELSGLTRSPFLLTMYNSFSDAKNVYLLLELCEGGDLYNLLRVTKSNRFNEETARFYMACVVMGLEAMHSRELVYRDLKPENLMLSKSGYIKVADFGLVKKTLRTFTVCGTPDYMAPEVILSRGHGMPVDWWAIGVLLFEMVGAVTPFFADEATDIYENVLAHETEEDLEFPDDVHFSEEAKSLIRKLLHPKKQKRLGVIHPGVRGVKEHPFFKSTKFDWDTLAKQGMKPPIMPIVVDMSKYASGTIIYDPKLQNSPDDHSGWKLNW